METSNLIKAHEHVRNAATATYDKSIATAGAEHELAASAFHEAAKETHNEEAARIIGLLEAHHSGLARRIKEPPRKKESSDDGPPQTPDTATSSPPARPSTSRTASPSTSASSPTRAPSRRRLPQSSIASNLAEKRGIPGARRGTATASAVSVTNALASRNERQSTPVRDLLQQQSRKAEEAEKQKDEPRKEAPTPAPREVSPPPDENFRRFYSAFGNIISTISAPLAFTSLPLNPTTSSTPTPANDPPPPALSGPAPSRNPHPTSPSTSTTIKASEPDLTALISKPALRALREDQSHLLGAPQESFYVVPPSGGTVSYASILRDPSSHAHHAAQDPTLDAITEVGESGGGLRGSSHEEFVDARESLNPPSPTTSRRPRSQGKGGGSSNSGGGGSTPTAPAVTSAATIRAGRGTGHKTMEELALENETLRALIDKQAKRLSMWETTSQSSYNVLAQSFRARSGAGGGVGGAVGPGLRQQMSDPSALAHALSQGAGPASASASPTLSHSPSATTPPVPQLPPQYSHQSTSSPSQSPSHPSSSDPSTHQRIATLESLLATSQSTLASLTSEKASLERQNEKNSVVLKRYREQWEKLKAGARRKEEERRERRVAEIRAGEQGTGTDTGTGSGTESGKNMEGEGGEREGAGGGTEETGDRDGDRDGDDGGASELVESVTFGKA